LLFPGLTSGFSLKSHPLLGMVTHAYNLSYLGGRD
jgi:hypothetical protein